MHRFLTLAFALLAVVWTAAAQPEASGVFFAHPQSSATKPSTSPATPLGKGTASRQLVGMHLDRLFGGGAGRVLLNVDGHEWKARLDRLDADLFGHRTWVGTIDDVEYSHVSVTERSGVVSGLINAVSETYQIRTISPGLYALERMTPLPGAAELEPLVHAPASAATQAVAAHAAPDESPETIDVLLLYTAAARNRVGGQPQIDALAAQVISDSNTIFSRSEVKPRLRLVGSAEAPYVENSAMLTDLFALTNSPAAHAVRDRVGADLVQMLVSSPDPNACGIAWLYNSLDDVGFGAFSVADVDCAFQYTPTHEMAHNMGSHHNRDNAAGAALFPYSYGYRDPAGSFRTVMAYNCVPSCPRIPNLSNPAVRFSAAAELQAQVNAPWVTLSWTRATSTAPPTGTDTANNARSLNEAAPSVARFRAAVYGNGELLGNETGATRLSRSVGFTLQIGSSPGASDVLSYDAGSQTSVTGFGDPGTYYWRVVTPTSAGGMTSPEAQFTISGCTPPGPPQELTHSVGAGYVISLQWTAPSSGPGPFAYTIEVGSAPGQADRLVAPVGALNTVAVAAPSGTYFVRVRAANACVASGPVSNERVIVIP